jgi:hypothetical protein
MSSLGLKIRLVMSIDTSSPSEEGKGKNVAIASRA